MSDVKIIQIDDLLNQTTEKRLSVDDLLKFPNNEDRIKLIEVSMTIINSFLEEEISKDKDLRFHIFQEIVSRAYGAIESALILLFSQRDFYALSILREVVEAEYLLNYFIMNLNEIEYWWNSDKKTRWQNFSPEMLRQKISSGNPKLKESMDRDYAGHSDFISHISPNSTQEKIQFTVYSKRGIYLGISICLHDISIHSYRIANILLMIMVASNRHDKKKSREEKISREVDAIYQTVYNSQRKLVSLRNFLSGKLLHVLHENKIIDYDKNGNLIIINEMKFKQEIEELILKMKN